MPEDNNSLETSLPLASYDAFISYSHANMGWVRDQLLPRLEAAHLTVCVDYRDFEPGAPRVTEMERAVTTSRRTLLVLTPDYLENDWAAFQALMLQTLDPANQERRIIPLLVEPCEPPLRIGYLTRVDLTENGEDEWQRLFRTLGASQPKAAGAPPKLTPLWRRWLWPLLSIILLVAVTAVGGFAWRMSQTLCGGNSLCVLVAEFSSQDEQVARDLAGEIRDELVEELGVDADEAVIRLARRVEDERAAQALAADEGALLLIWGSIKELNSNKVRVRFELADLLGVGESTALRTYRAEPINYDEVSGQVECTDCFDVSLGELGQRIDIVAHAAAGFLQYADRPELAYHEFLQALHCAGEEIDGTLLNLLDPQCEVTKQPEDWSPQLLTYYAGKSAALSGEYAAAIDLLTRAAEENPVDPAAMLGIAAGYRAWIGADDAPEVLDALAEAERRIDELLTHVSERANLAVLHYNLGLARELAGDWEDAADEYGQAAGLFGEDASAYVSLVQQGHAQRLAGDVDGAETTIRKAIDLDPHAPWAYLELADLAWHGHEDADAALGWLDQAGDKAASEAVAVLLQRAELCLSWEDFACAEDAYQRALALHNGSGWLHMHAGDFYRPTNPVLPHQSWQLAADQYELAQNYRSRDPWLHERLGYVALNTGEYDAAIEHYGEAIDLAYGDAAPGRLFCALAVAYGQTGQVAEATQAQSDCDQDTPSAK